MLRENHSRSNSSNRGMALILTLAVLLMAAVIVVTYSTIVRMETSSARSSFESVRAEQFCQMAVDEATAKLRDNIPLDSQWAAGPGRLCAFKSGQWIFTDLFSGKADGSSTGSVALNAPSLGAGSSYPILPPSSEHPTPDLMNVAWINVLQDGTLSTDIGYATKLATTNPIVGRFAYWVDTETSKVNLNTAGRAQTSYTFTISGTGDLQNLTGHPSRVDLSKLDDKGGAISLASGTATYGYTASSYWGGDKISGFEAAPSTRTVGDGMKRFNSIDEWTNISGISPDMIEANRFNLTVLARAPELTPWGYNKWWWQNNPPQQITSLSNPGNRINAPGNPVFPGDIVLNPAAFAAGVGPTSQADLRYYVYPVFLGKLDATPALSTYSKNTQWMGSSASYRGPTIAGDFPNYMQSVMDLLSRKDWPGFPSTSFVDKYGQAECEDLAVDLMYLYDSTAGAGGQSPYRIMNAIDKWGIYGKGFFPYTRSTGASGLLSGIGPWPYLNEVAVKFAPTRNGYTPNPGPSVNVIEITNAAQTKSQRRPGFSKPITSLNYGANYLNYMNVEMTPSVEIYFPSGLGAAVQATNVISISEVEVIATGIFNGAPVNYSGSDYIWGRPDDYTNGTAAPGGAQANGFGGTPTFLSNPTPQWINFAGRQMYIGPFDVGTTPQVTLKFRAASSKQNRRGDLPPLQVAPLPSSYNPDAINETPDVPTSSTKFTFSCSSLALTDVNLLIPLSVWQSYEAPADPRIYRYLSDWKKNPTGHTLGQINSSYTKTYVDPLTGLTGDDSKLAWPDTSMAMFGANDWRTFQTAAHIVGFPGVGWLSVLPTNVETGGVWSGSTRTPTPTKIVPWRTLNFGPATNPSQLPDWLLIDNFAVAYDQSYLSQTQGKININAEVYPFGFNRLAPLKALLIQSAANGTTDADKIAQDIADREGIQSGPCANLPAEMFVYSGQIAQITSLQGSGTNQWQKEALIRDIAGLVTTQCSDFRVYVVAQALNKVGKMVAERRISALVSRTVDVGPDEIPGTADDMAGPDRVVGTADDLVFKSGAGSPVVKLNYDGNDPPPEGGSGRPPFHYQITDLQLLTP